MDENLFEEELTIAALSAMGNPLELLSALVDFEMFRPELEDILVKKDCKSAAGRPQFDVVLMLKVIFLQRYYGLGDKQIQYQIIYRTSFRQFLSRIQHIQICANQQIPAAAYRLYGITVS